MAIESIAIQGVRNLALASPLNFHPRFNFIFGANGSGKSSLLEAIYLIGTARSFRTHHIDEVIKRSKSELVIHARTSNTLSHGAGIRRQRNGECEIKIDGEARKSRSELARLTPMVFIVPESLELISGPPSQRRNYLEWIMFHVEHDYHHVWLQYQRVLRQRNALLKSRTFRRGELTQWNGLLYNYGVEIDRLRRLRIPSLIASINDFTNRLDFPIELSIEYEQGWRGESLNAALEASTERDTESGYTHQGPHRADLKIRAAGRPAKDFLSRGQLKIISMAAYLAQYELARGELEKEVVLVIDDVSSELDENHRKWLLSYLAGFNSQVMITVTEMELLGDIRQLPHKVFHVKHGSVEEVVY